MSKRRNLYVGRGGQMAVMAEFLLLGYNVAIPEVDVGDDIFVVRDKDGDLQRIQVKTANARALQQGYATTFSVRMRQLEAEIVPDLYYVLAVRHERRWQEFVIIAQEDLRQLRKVAKLGSLTPNGEQLVLRISFSDDNALCSGYDLQAYRNNWSNWPPIDH